MFNAYYNDITRVETARKRDRFIIYSEKSVITCFKGQLYFLVVITDWSLYTNTVRTSVRCYQLEKENTITKTDEFILLN